MGVPRRGHRLSRFRSVWTNTTLSVAGSPSAAVCADSEHYGQYAGLAAGRCWRWWEHRECGGGTLQSGEGAQWDGSVQLFDQRGGVGSGCCSDGFHLETDALGVWVRSQHTQSVAMGGLGGGLGSAAETVCGEAS